MVEEIQEYQNKWHNYVERMPPERLPWQTYSSSSYWKTGHWASKKEMETIPSASERANGLNP
jgi:hypothetical protein